MEKIKRNRKIIKYSILLVLIFAIVCVPSFSQAETSISERINDAVENKKSSESMSKKLEKEIAEFEKDKDDVLSYISKIDKKTAKLEKELILIEKEIKKTQKEIKKAKKELLKAQEEQEAQYNTMKKRIKYMYENGNEEYLNIIFSSKNMGDLLNHTEYIEKISEFDKNIFNEYLKISQQVKEKKKEKDRKDFALKLLRADDQDEKEALSLLKSNKKSELKTYNTNIKNSKAQKAAFERQALAAEAEVEKLLSEQNRILMQTGAGDIVGSSGKLRWPLKIRAKISSYFGKRSRPTPGASTYHKGIDLSASYGTEIVAADGGKVVTATYSSSAGNYIMIAHGDGLNTVYMHCSRLAVGVGQNVKKGQVIGYVGSTGVSTGSHLHFGVMKKGKYVNPLLFVKRPNK